jgi:hypothetical protein
VYISYQKNLETGTNLDIYDNSVGVDTNNKTYRIVNVYVGDLQGGKEIPVPFLKEENNHEIYLPIDKGEVRDIDGNYVQNNTVVEMIYTNDPSVQHQYRWSILRTRWDKT